MVTKHRTCETILMLQHCQLPTEPSGSHQFQFDPRSWATLGSGQLGTLRLIGEIFDAPAMESNQTLEIQCGAAISCE